MGNNHPTLLYRYMTFKRGFELISEKKLRLSPHASYNDPFEFLPKTAPNVLLKKKMEDSVAEYADSLNDGKRDEKLDFFTSTFLVSSMTVSMFPILFSLIFSGSKNNSGNDIPLKFTKEFSEFISKTRVCCFSEVKDSIKLWSHYSDGHKGMAISFDPSMHLWGGDHFQKVKYSKNRIDQSDFSQSDINDFIKLLITTKSNHWSEEKEWRYIKYEADRCPFFMDNNHQGEEIKVHYENINIKSIKSIYLGYKMPLAEQKRIISYRDTNLPGVTIEKAILSDNEYSLDFESI